MSKRAWTVGVAAVVITMIGIITVMILDRKSRADDPPQRYADSASGSREYGLLPSLPNVRFQPPPAIVQSNTPSSDYAARRANIGAPGIDVTAAPGVAFNYRYAFRLPNSNIAGVQEQHAQACEKLGVARCRIIGMRYTVANEDQVAAMLAFKLDPALARQFGKDGIAAIQKAQGSLVDAEISGVDAGNAINQSRRQSDEMATQLKDYEAQLRAENLRPDERTSLRSRIEMLRSRLQNEASTRIVAEESLATTPMVFQYNSGSALSTSALGDAWSTASTSFVSIIGFFIVALGVILPWLVLCGLAYLLAGPAIRRWRRNTEGSTPPAEEAVPTP